MPTTRTPHCRTTQVSNMSTTARGASKLRLNLGSLTDAASIQRAISVVVGAVTSDDLEVERARLILYGLQIASTNAKRLGEHAKTSTVDSGDAVVATQNSAAEPEAVLPLKEQAEASMSADDVTECEACDATAEASMTTQQATEGTMRDESAGVFLTEVTPEAPEEESTAATTPPQHKPGEVYVPPSCFASARGYQGNARERILSFKQQQRT